MLQALVLILTSTSSLTMTPEMLDLLTPSKTFEEACGYDSCPRMWPDALNVHIVPHTHYEVGFQRHFHEHYTGYDQFGYSEINMKRTLDYIITDLWADKERRFTLSDLPYFFHWWSKRDPTVRRMVFQLLRQGRLYFVGGGWGLNDEATTSYHAIIESFTYSLRKVNATFLSCGQPLVAWQSDGMGHSREFASLAAQMGYDGLFLHPISFDDMLARMKRKGLEFLWRGSDDLGPASDIFTHVLFDGYWSPPGFCFATNCEDPLIVTSNSLTENGPERAKAFIESMLFRQSPNYNTSHVMVMMGMMFGYWDSAQWFANIERLMVTIGEVSAESKTRINVVYSTPACYLKEVRNENPRLETKQDDFFPYANDKRTFLTGFYTSCPSLKLLAKEGLVFLQMAKQMQVLARMFNNDQFFEEFMWAFGLFLDHTVITGTLLDHVKQFYVHKLYIAIQKSTLLLKQAWNKIRRAPKGTLYYRCSLNISSCHIARATNSFLVIYNPLAWHVSLPVRLPVSYPGEYEVYAPPWEKIKVSYVQLPQPIIRLKGRMYSADYDLVFLAESLPPLGYRSYFVSRTAETRKKRTLIKNIKKKHKKYLIRQNLPIGDDHKLLNDLDDYSEYDDHQPKTMFANMSNDELTDDVEGEDIKLVETRDEYRPTINWELEGDNTTQAYITMDSDETTIKIDSVENINSTTEEPAIEEETMTTAPPTEVEEKKKVEKQENVEFNENMDDKDDDSTAPGSKPTQIHPTPTVQATQPPTTTAQITTEAQPPTEPPKDEQAEIEEKIKQKQEMRRKMYSYESSTDSYIENKYIRINLDVKSRKIVDMTLSNGVHINLDLQFYYYASDEPDRLGKQGFKRPGASVFRAAVNKPIPILDYLDVKVYKKSIVEEIQYIYSDWTSLVVRLYKDSPVIEVDWLVGPVPIEDSVGKEVFIRYMTDLVNEAAFFTDSNGRQTIRRIRNMRPMFETINNDPVAGNYYPVTSKIYIEDLKKDIRFSVFNDRAQGGSSPYDGEIDLMLVRRILTDDTSFNTFVNDTEYGEGVVVRGKHFLYVSKANYNPNKIFEKKLAKEIELAPQILISSPDPYDEKTRENWLDHTNEKSFLKNKLPVGIHILTLEKWSEGALLLRLENYLEKSDVRKKGAKIVEIKELFTNIVIYKIRETTLAANIWLDSYVPLRWRKKEKFVKNFNEFYGTQRPVEFEENETPPTYEEPDLNKGISLTPQQIRTFVCWFDYND